MADGEIVARLVGHLRVRVDERRVRIAEDVGVGLILHHDEKDMIEPSELALRHVALGGMRCRCAERQCCHGCEGAVHGLLSLLS
jgi:hypothetical protein